VYKSQVRNAKLIEAPRCAVEDVNCVIAQHEVEQRCRRALLYG